MSSTAATPAGNCPRCAGQLYDLLVHQCTTTVRRTFTVADPLGTNPPIIPQLWPPSTNAKP